MSFWRDRRVLVTGATGFLGTALVTALRAEGARVARLLRPAATGAARGDAAGDDVASGDVVAGLNDAGLATAMADRGIEVVFHLAALSMPEQAAADPAGTFAVNAGGTWAVLDACRRSGSVRRVVIASSCKVYGEGGEAALAEDAPLRGTGAYDLSKIAAEAIGRGFHAYRHGHAPGGLMVGIARTANLYGPGDAQVARIVPGAIHAVLAGARPVIHSDGTAERDYLFVDDAVAAFLRLAERLDEPGVSGEAFNIGTGEPVSVREIATLVAAAAGRPDLVPDVRGRAGGGVSRQRMDCAQAGERLDWRPAAPLRQRLAETVATERGLAASPSMPRPRVLVGIPTLDRPAMVRETIASVLAQDFADIAVVVSDNVSAPDTVAAVRAHVAALGDARVRFVAQPANGGEYGQGRFLFAEAERLGADYFTILHDDDLLDPRYLARGVTALDAASDVALYVANPRLIDAGGAPDPERTRGYLADHGRVGRTGGRFDILDTHMACGFTPISGTLFRTAACAAAGLTDEDCAGNYPFECNVMLRLGDVGAAGWFDPETLIAFRFHPGSLRVTLRLMDNPAVVGTMLTLFERRRYAGAIERRRRVLVARLHRAWAIQRLRAGDVGGARTALGRACAANPRSARAWMLRGAVGIAPGLVRARL